MKKTDKFTSGDILEMAVQAKKKGIELYLALAKNSGNYYVGKVFMELAKDEKRHKREMDAWLEKVKGEKREEAYPGERALFLKSLVESSTFNCDTAQEKALEKTIDEEDALRAAVNFEKDFMLFLHELKKHVSEKEAGTIDVLLDEEMRHIKDIFALKDKLEKGE